MACQYRLGLGEVLRAVGIEEGIVRLGRPHGLGNAVARRPAVDLAHVLDHQRVPEIGRKRHRPQADHRVRLVAGPRTGQRHARRSPRLVQPGDEIARQERRVRRDRQHPADLRPVDRDPFQRGEDAGERSGETLHRVRHHGQSKPGKARGVAVGIDDEPVALRPDAVDRPGNERASADRPKRLVTAAHAAGETSGEQHAEGRGMVRRGHGQSSAPLRRWRALSSST